LLERARVAGNDMGIGPRELRSYIERVVAGDRRALGNLAPIPSVTVVDAWRAVGTVFGASKDEPRIDASRTLGAFDRAVERIRAVGTAGGSIAFATARPASLLPLHHAIARFARAAGAIVADSPDAGPIRADGRSPRWVRWIDGVAVVTDGAGLLATNDGEPAGEWLFLTPRPALAVVDGPFGEVAFEGGLEIVAFAGLDRAALAVAAARHPRATVVPIRTDRSPASYGSLTARMVAG
jgi:hypothetical protein